MRIIQLFLTANKVSYFSSSKQRYNPMQCLEQLELTIFSYINRKKHCKKICVKYTITSFIKISNMKHNMH